MKTFNKFNLSGKTALITGGAMGLGFHMAKALAEAGATVLIAARREKVLREAAELLNSDPEIGDVRWYPVDQSAKHTRIKQPCYRHIGWR